VASSEEQFHELLAHLIARANQMLKSSAKFSPTGLILHSGGEVETMVGVADTDEQVGQVVNAMLESMRAKVVEAGAVAVCIAYQSQHQQSVVALVENDENYCAKIFLPFLGSPPQVDLSGISQGDGDVYVFPIAG
jgi:hypothetical protein